jgi:hypothetical protein
MQRHFAGGTALLMFPVALAGLAVSTPRLLAQTQSQTPAAATGLPNGAATMDQVLRGRLLVASSGCSDCHNRGPDNPDDPHWLAGYLPNTPGQPFQIGPFKTYPANLTPDPATGLGKASDRQVFNALRYGLDPKTSPDVIITSTTPGQGNFPATPQYLAPPMPWPSFRHKADDDLWAIVAYLKHGLKPISNAVPDSEGPPDHWASSYTLDQTGPYPFPAYPAGSETFTP